MVSVESPYVIAVKPASISQKRRVRIASRRVSDRSSADAARNVTPDASPDEGVSPSGSSPASSG